MYLATIRSSMCHILLNQQNKMPTYWYTWVLYFNSNYTAIKQRQFVYLNVGISIWEECVWHLTKNFGYLDTRIKNADSLPKFEINRIRYETLFPENSRLGIKRELPSPLFSCAIMSLTAASERTAQISSTDDRVPSIWMESCRAASVFHSKLLYFYKSSFGYTRTNLGKWCCRDDFHARWSLLGDWFIEEVQFYPRQILFTYRT